MLLQIGKPKFKELILICIMALITSRKGVLAAFIDFKKVYDGVD